MISNQQILPSFIASSQLTKTKIILWPCCCTVHVKQSFLAEMCTSVHPSVYRIFFSLTFLTSLKHLHVKVNRLARSVSVGVLKKCIFLEQFEIQDGCSKLWWTRHFQPSSPEPSMWNSQTWQVFLWGPWRSVTF